MTDKEYYKIPREDDQRTDWLWFWGLVFILTGIVYLGAHYGS